MGESVVAAIFIDTILHMRILELTGSLSCNLKMIYHLLLWYEWIVAKYGGDWWSPVEISVKS